HRRGLQFGRLPAELRGWCRADHRLPHGSDGTPQRKDMSGRRVWHSAVRHLRRGDRNLLAPLREAAGRGASPPTSARQHAVARSETRRCPPNGSPQRPRPCERARKTEDSMRRLPSASVIVAIALGCLLIHGDPRAADGKCPVSVFHKGEDSVGSRFSLVLKERIAASPRYRLVEGKAGEEFV